MRGISIPPKEGVANHFVHLHYSLLGFLSRPIIALHSVRSITPSFVVFRYCVPQSYVGIIKRSLSDEVMERQFDSVARKRNYVGEKDT